MGKHLQHDYNNKQSENIIMLIKIYVNLMVFKYKKAQFSVLKNVVVF